MSRISPLFTAFQKKTTRGCDKKLRTNMVSASCYLAKNHMSSEFFSSHTIVRGFIVITNYQAFVMILFYFEFLNKWWLNSYNRVLFRCKLAMVPTQWCYFYKALTKPGLEKMSSLDIVSIIWAILVDRNKIWWTRSIRKITNQVRLSACSQNLEDRCKISWILSTKWSIFRALKTIVTSW